MLEVGCRGDGAAIPETRWEMPVGCFGRLVGTDGLGCAVKPFPTEAFWAGLDSCIRVLV
jgi:hypothetical protein